MNGFNGFNDYLIAQFTSGIKVCKAPFASMIKAGDLVEVKHIYGKGKVIAAESASDNNSLLDLIKMANYPDKEAFEVTAIYSKKEIKWGNEDE